MKKHLIWVLRCHTSAGWSHHANSRFSALEAQKVGPLQGGGFLLNNGWTIKPAGTQVPVDTLPMSTALSRNGKYLLVLNAGYNPPSISVIDIQQKKEVGRTKLADAFSVLRFRPRMTKSTSAEALPAKYSNSIWIRTPVRLRPRVNFRRSRSGSQGRLADWRRGCDV